MSLKSIPTGLAFLGARYLTELSNSEHPVDYQKSEPELKAKIEIVGLYLLLLQEAMKGGEIIN